jgi:hypothetical protein
MKKQMLLALWLSLIAITVFITSCKKSVDPLPSETAIGANTFGCKVNGVAYIPSGGDPSGGIYPISGGPSQDPAGNRGLYIQTISGKQDLDLYVKNATDTGEYVFELNTVPQPIAVISESYACYGENGIGINTGYHITNAIYTGKIKITRFDRTARIVAGTFSFTAYNATTKTTIVVTDGRFDRKY